MMAPTNQFSGKQWIQEGDKSLCCILHSAVHQVGLEARKAGMKLGQVSDATVVPTRVIEEGDKGDQELVAPGVGVAAMRIGQRF
jgi:hypothetical protein